MRLAALWMLVWPTLAHASDLHDPAYSKELLVYANINFALFIALLVVLLRKPLREFLVRRRQEVTQEITRVENERRALAEQLTALQSRWARIDDEAAALARDLAAATEEEQRRIAAQARALAKATARSTDQRIAALEREAGRQILEEAVALLTGRTDAELKRRIDDAADRRISAALADRVGALS